MLLLCCLFFSRSFFLRSSVSVWRSSAQFNNNGKVGHSAALKSFSAALVCLITEKNKKYLRELHYRTFVRIAREISGNLLYVTFSEIILNLEIFGNLRVSNSIINTIFKTELHTV